MTTLIVWLLIAKSAAYNNYGGYSTIERFATKEDCVALMKQLDDQSTNFYCKQAKIVVAR